MSHVRWEDLVEAEEAPPAPLDLGAAAQLDPRLAQLVRERAELQARMDQLVGGAPAGEAPTDERQAKQFPVLRHTAETKLAAKLEHRRETDTRLASQRVYARRKASDAEAERVEELRRARIVTTRRARERARRDAERRAARERREAAARQVVRRALERVAAAAFGHGERPDLHALGTRALSLARAGDGAATIAPRGRAALAALDRPLLPAMPMSVGDVGSVGSIGDIGPLEDPMALDVPAEPMPLEAPALDPMALTPRTLLAEAGLRLPAPDDMRLDRLARRGLDLLDRPRRRGAPE